MKRPLLKRKLAGSRSLSIFPLRGAQPAKPIIEKLSAEPQYQGLTIFEVDFDTRKDVLRKFGAQTQSTLIVFKGDKETGRSVGSTDADAIDALLHKAL